MSQAAVKLPAVKPHAVKLPLLKLLFREPLIKSLMNSLSPARIVNRWPVTALLSTCNNPAMTSTYRPAPENAESRSVSPRLNQKTHNSNFVWSRKINQHG